MITRKNRVHQHEDSPGAQVTMSDGPHSAEVRLDASGRMCPEPITMAALRLQGMQEGEVLRVEATDPAAPIDFEVWCLRRQHTFLDCRQNGERWIIRLRKGGIQT